MVNRMVITSSERWAGHNHQVVSTRITVGIDHSHRIMCFRQWQEVFIIFQQYYALSGGIERQLKMLRPPCDCFGSVHVHVRIEQPKQKLQPQHSVGRSMSSMKTCPSSNVSASWASCAQLAEHNFFVGSIGIVHVQSGFECEHASIFRITCHTTANQVLHIPRIAHRDALEAPLVPQQVGPDICGTMPGRYHKWHA
ncbi:MAG: hypothetical protein VCF25_03260 [Candidatus Poribacteria bacterium]